MRWIHIQKFSNALRIVLQYGNDILLSKGMQSSKQYIQHGNISVYDHSVNVAILSVWLADRLHMPVDAQALVTGALLHDYFLYDWHVRSEDHRWHGIHHPKRAFQNAQRDFKIGAIESNMILSHMFPLCPTLPMHRESWILYLADKICAIGETLFKQFPVPAET